MTAALCIGTAARARCLRLRFERLPVVWSRHLSVLDAEVNGERWLWHVPARPGNDVGTDGPHFAAHPEITAKATRGAVRRVEKVGNPRAFHSVAHVGQRQNREKSVRQSTLTAWLREQDGGAP